jgi:hypothetical protein
MGLSQLEISTLPRLLAVEVLLAEPEALDDDVLESCLYILREKLTGNAGPGAAPHLTGSAPGSAAACSPRAAPHRLGDS